MISFFSLKTSFLRLILNHKLGMILKDRYGIDCIVNFEDISMEEYDSTIKLKFSGEVTCDKKLLIKLLKR